LGGGEERIMQMMKMELTMLVGLELLFILLESGAEHLVSIELMVM